MTSPRRSIGMRDLSVAGKLLSRKYLPEISRILGADFPFHAMSRAWIRLIESSRGGPPPRAQWPLRVVGMTHRLQSWSPQGTQRITGFPSAPCVRCGEGKNDSHHATRLRNDSYRGSHDHPVSGPPAIYDSCSSEVAKLKLSFATRRTDE